MSDDVGVNELFLKLSDSFLPAQDVVGLLAETEPEEQTASKQHGGHLALPDDL